MVGTPFGSHSRNLLALPTLRKRSIVAATSLIAKSMLINIKGLAARAAFGGRLDALHFDAG
jgi:hypothetical protein